MLTQQRRDKILEILGQNGSIEVTDISKKLGASESTIRRDIIFLSNLGKLNKVHGGATQLPHNFSQNEDTFINKSLKNVEEKTKIAKYAASLINDDDFIFIDAGSTTWLLTQFIENTGATFVTNGISQAKELAKKNIKVILLGGEFKETTEAVTGIEAAVNMQKYNFSKAFIGTNGVTEKQGFTTPDNAEGIVKSVAVERSFVSYVLCDSTKFGKVSGYSFSKLEASCIITAKCGDDSIKKKTVVKEID